MKIITALAVALTIVSCKNPEQNARIGSLTNLAISIAESRGAITKQDAADIRAAGTIVLAPADSAKAPVNVQP